MNRVLNATTAGQIARYSGVELYGGVVHIATIVGIVQLTPITYWIAFFMALPITYTSKFLLNKLWTFRA